MSDIQRVAVVGGGTMGNGIAHVFAQHGRAVTLIDVDESRLATAAQTIRSNLDRQVKKGTLSAADADATVSRISTTTSRSAAGDAQLIVEARDPNAAAVVVKPADSAQATFGLDAAAKILVVAT